MTSFSKLAFNILWTLVFMPEALYVDDEDEDEDEGMRARERHEDVMVLIENNLRERLYNIISKIDCVWEICNE